MEANGKTLSTEQSLSEKTSQILSQKEIFVRSKILDWAGPIFPLEVREEAARVLVDYLDARNPDEVEYYTSELKFGTGGLRGIIGNGAGRMNRWTVGRTTMGYCNYLKKGHRTPSLVIAHDSRRMSAEFAAVTAGIAAALGFKVFLFQGVTPTPILSYAIRKLKASGGVVITASHNPPQYNGYKVYLNDGSQLVGPSQKSVEKSIEAVDGWEKIPFTEPRDPVYKKRVKKIGPDIKKSYYAEFDKVPFVSSRRSKNKSRLKIVYTPLHGTGGKWLPGLLSRYGFRVELVAKQAEPDGEFPTVRYPNPEEAEAMALAEETAKNSDADIYLATDPDADRLGVGVKKAPGEYVILNGNQIGSIMSAYLCEKANQSKSKFRWHIYKTIVTSNLELEIAGKNNISIHNTLTGFKYIAEHMRYLDQGNKTFKYSKGKDGFLFGNEESIGYLPVGFVRDKDSLSSALLLCEILAEKGDLLAFLNQIYLKYGLYLEDLKSVTMKGASGQQKIKETIQALRNNNMVGHTFGSRRVVSVLDYEKGTRNGKKSAKDFAGLPPSNVLQFFLEPEGLLTIRPSGTEPKVKLYGSLRHPDQPSSLEELEIAKQELKNELASISGHFLANTGLT